MKARLLGLCAIVVIASGVLGQQSPVSQNRTIPGETSPSNDKPTSNNPVKSPGTFDQKFLKQAGIGDAAEIELGQMAQSKAQDPNVRQFGERMVKDHSKNDDQLKAVAQSQHIGLPTGLDPQHRDQKSQLESKSGSQFDQDYMRLMVQDHEKTVAAFKRAASTSEDPTVKAYAQNSLPVLESLQEAKQVQSQVESKEKH